MVSNRHKRKPSAIQALRKRGASDDSRASKQRHSKGNLKQYLQTSGAKMKKYLIIIEKSRSGFGAYSPDLPGCVAVGATRREVKKLLREAMSLHLKGLKEDGIKVPLPSTQAEYLEVAA